MQLQCALVGRRGGPVSIDIDASLSTGALKSAIAKEMASGIQCHAHQMLLYSAKNEDGWLRSDDPHVKAMAAGATPDDIRVLLANSVDLASSTGAAFAGAVTKDVIHVLVVDPKQPTLRTRKIDEVDNEQAISAWEPPLKKPALNPNTVTGKGPVQEDAIIVPFESIDANQQIKREFAKPPGSDRPLFLLCGPIGFGKLNIARRISNWIDTNPSLDDAKCISLGALRPSEVKDEKGLWSKLGKLFDAQSACVDQDSLLHLVTRDQKRFFLIVENMDQLLENQDMASKFLTALSAWKKSASFCGFLGIGSQDLQHHHKIYVDCDQPCPFDSAHVLTALPFFVDQMSVFFALFDPTNAFPPSLRQGIMDYSSGAPGIFGSLVRFTIDQDKWRLEWEDWEAWFKLSAYSILYLQLSFPGNYHRIRIDLQKLSGLEWDALTFVLQNHGMLTISDVEDKCGVDIPSAQGKSVVDTLLKSGVLMQQTDVKLAVISKLLHRLCVKSSPAPPIKRYTTKWVKCWSDQSFGLG